MKELSIEEKANAYDEVVNKLRHFILQGVDPLITRADVQDFFPELKESEGERIMEKIIATIHLYYGEPLEDEAKEMIAWLEKQESEPNWCHHKVDLSNCSEEYRKAYYDGWNNCNQQHSQCKSEGNNVVKCLLPKFKVDDWVVWDNKISCHIDNIYQGKESLMYTITDTNNMTRSYSVKGFDNNARLWSIEDAKPGDVIKEDSCIFIIERMKPNWTAIIHCCLFDDGDFDLGSTLSFDVDSTYPATKEQRDILFSKMHEAGYTFDFEKKELKKLKFRVGDEVITENEGSLTITRIDEEGYWSNDLFICDFDSECIWDLVEKKPAEWSKEDEGVLSDAEGWLDTLCDYLKDSSSECIPHVKNVINRLNTIKNRIVPQPKQAWSEEDESNLRRAIRTTKVVYPATADWLKFLKDRVQPQPKQEWKQENREELTEFENAMMHIGGSFFGENAGLDPNDTDTIKEQAELLLELAPKTEWSEEDERIYQSIIDDTVQENQLDSKQIDWLKSIRNRITCKPSIEQMKILEKVTEVDIEKTLNGFQNFYAHENSGEFPSAIEIAKHFYELGLKASDTELENLLWTLPESIADERSRQVYLMSLYHCDGQCVVDYVGELEEDSLVCFVGETFMEAATKMREWIRKRPKLRKI